MRKLVLVLAMIILMNSTIIVRAEENKPFKILTTAYCYGETTCTGAKARYGICAVKKSWIGKTVVIYERTENDEPGNLLGIFEALDTGVGGDSDGNGIGAIQEGKVIDVFFDNFEQCKEWMKLTNGKVYAQVLDAQG